MIVKRIDFKVSDIAVPDDAQKYFMFPFMRKDPDTQETIFGHHFSNIYSYWRTFTASNSTMEEEYGKEFVKSEMEYIKQEGGYTEAKEIGNPHRDGYATYMFRGFYAPVFHDLPVDLARTISTAFQLLNTDKEHELLSQFTFAALFGFVLRRKMRALRDKINKLVRKLKGGKLWNMSTKR